MIDKIRHLLAFSDTPRYNIKAVVQQTQVNVSTLRAWEQRYGVPQPKRTDQGHRLYSQRDIEIIKWLKQATEDGVAISQAVAMLVAGPEERQLGGESGSVEAASPMVHIGEAGWPDLRKQLLTALLDVDLRQAHVLMNTAVSLFPVDVLVFDVILPIMADFGQQWMNGTSCIANEQVAVQFFRQRLASLMQIHAPFTHGPRLICGGAPGDQHELGVLIYALLMEQQGWDVIYLGSNLGVEGVSEFLVKQAPALFVLSASMIDQVVAVQQIGQMALGLHHHGIHFGYAGRAFVNNPELCQRMPGTYMGDDFAAALQQAIMMSEENNMTPWHDPKRLTRAGVHTRMRFGLQ